MATTAVPAGREPFETKVSRTQFGRRTRQTHSQPQCHRQQTRQGLREQREEYHAFPEAMTGGLGHE